MKHVRGKVIAALALATGYVLGTKAGRGRYEKLKDTAVGAWKDPRVQDTVHAVEDVAKDKAQSAGESLRDAARSTVETVSDKVNDLRESADEDAS